MLRALLILIQIEHSVALLGRGGGGGCAGAGALATEFYNEPCPASLSQKLCGISRHAVRSTRRAGTRHRWNRLDELIPEVPGGRRDVQHDMGCGKWHGRHAGDKSVLPIFQNSALC